MGVAYEFTFEEVPPNGRLELKYLGLVLMMYDQNYTLLTETLAEKTQETLRQTCLNFSPSRIDETKLKRTYELPSGVRFVTVLRNIKL